MHAIDKLSARRKVFKIFLHTMIFAFKANARRFVCYEFFHKKATKYLSKSIHSHRALSYPVLLSLWFAASMQIQNISLNIRIQMQSSLDHQVHSVRHTQLWEAVLVPVSLISPHITASTEFPSEVQKNNRKIRIE